ncbi:MAG TPA: (Fe-S)-binding protein [bacterium]|nr:(Fe-S)-binding protein [bacterium]
MAAKIRDNLIDGWRENLARCLRCGLCREVCPAFRATASERFSPRGRLALLEAALEGEPPAEEFGAPFLESLAYCLSCRACAERCPSGVAGDVLVLAAREAGLCRGGFPFFKSWAYRLALGRPRLLALLTRLLYVAQQAHLLPFALWFFGLPPRLALPKLEAKPFDASREQYFIPAEGTEWRGRVTYFAGCGATYLYPSTARAVVELLTRAGYLVFVPAARRCCGIPALANGDVDLARELAARNVAALAGDEPVVVDCGSCGTMLTYYYNDVLEVPGAASFKERVKDFTELIPPDVIEARDDGRVTYHDPCHLARGLGVTAEPRTLLSKIGRLVELEAPGAVTCCGGAGAYGLTYDDVFAKIGGEKAAAVEATGADVVATGCPACVLYINEALRRRGAKAEARHTAEVLNEGGGP